MERARKRKRLQQLCYDIKTASTPAFYLRHLGAVRQSGARLQAGPLPSPGTPAGKSKPLVIFRGAFTASLARRGRCDPISRVEPCVVRPRGAGDGARLGINSRVAGTRALASIPPRHGDVDDRAPPTSTPTAICSVFLTSAATRINGGTWLLARRGLTRRRRGAPECFISRPRLPPRDAEDARRFALEELQRGGSSRKAHLTFTATGSSSRFVEGSALYLQARTTAAGVEPRWHNMRGAVPSLYNADTLENLPSGAVVYLVEGFTDTLTLAAHNFAAVGLVGAGGLKAEWLAPLGRFNVVAVFDPDGWRRAAARYAEMLMRAAARRWRASNSRGRHAFFRQRRRPPSNRPSHRGGARKP